MENQALELQKEFKAGDLLGSPYMPQTITKKMELANILGASGLCPPALNTPEKVFVALQYGHELGLSPMVSIQNIAVINNRPSIMTDVMSAIAMKSGKLLELKVVEIKDNSKKVIEVQVKGKRKDPDMEYTGSFSLEEAKEAGLMGKDNWKKYSKRMLEHRAKAYCLKTLFPELLAGLLTPDEAESVPEIRDVTPKSALNNVKENLANEADKTIKDLEKAKEEIKDETKKEKKESAKKRPTEKEKKKVDDNVSNGPEIDDSVSNIFDIEEDESPESEKFDPQEKLLSLLERAKAVKTIMDKDHFAYFKSIAVQIKEGNFDFSQYTEDQYNLNLDLVKNLEKKAGKKNG